MENLFIGIDISKDVFDYCFLNQKNEILSKGQQANTEKGITKFCKEISKYKGYSPWICMEHTGYYGYLLAYEFSRRTLTYSLLSPLDLKLSMGLVRGKDDDIDAYRIASYSLSNKHKLKLDKLPIDKLQKLKVLMKTRDRYNKISIQLKNALKGIKIVSKSIELDGLIEEHNKTIVDFEKKIKTLEKEMKELISSCEELKKTYKKITSVVGVGPITAIKCIIETDNFSKYINPRKFNCHCGLAPFKHKSGSSVRGKTKTSPLCNKVMKGILYKAAWSAIQHDPQLKRYYNTER